ncbi:hypothetical protein, partial [Methylobacterium sp. V23]|uniref:hypothetical protein n=1 Tax=Methylobacterium sp. V23 TaxID=2044878 RepID=UPI001AECD464
AQPLKIDTTHPTRESAKPNPRKGVGNYLVKRNGSASSGEFMRSMPRTITRSNHKSYIQIL